MRDYMNYDGKVCVVTGASSGMGLATAKILLDSGAKVYGISRHPCPTEGINSICADLSKKEEICRAFDQIPEAIDCFFGVAGLSGAKTDYMTTFNVNYTANMFITETYLKSRMTSGGSILFVTSMAGIAWRENMDECRPILDIPDWDLVQNIMSELVPANTSSNLSYMLAKRLTNAYACQLAVELAPQGIRVNTVLPDCTDSGMVDEFAAMMGGKENMIKYAGLANRLAHSEEVAMPIVFLNSQMASFISGEELYVDICNYALKKLGIRQEMCAGSALPKK